MVQQQRPIFILIHALGHGGVTNAVLDQSSMFLEAGHPTTILTLTSEADRSRIQQLRASGRLAPGVQVRNIHWDYQDAWASATERPDPTGLDVLRGVPGRLVERGKDASSTYERWFDSMGGYLAHVRLREDGSVSQVTRFQHRIASSREYFDARGAVRRAEEISRSSHISREAYYAPSGVAYAVRVADPGSGKGRGLVVHWPGGNEAGSLVSGVPDWHAGWIRSVLDESGPAPIVLTETPTTIPKMVKARRPDDTVIGMLHNNQFAEPFTVGSPLRGDHRALFRDVQKLDALVVLTDPQRRDVVDLGVPSELVHVVPNVTRLPPAASEAKDPLLVSMMTRIAPQKALHEAVHAFQRVLAEVPEARLEIYGSGPSVAAIRRLIDELELQDSVLLMGRTPDPHGVMARSVCTLSTSDWEAMPLSILESEAAATPVVAYNCLYGPATLIDDGVTGRLVPRGDRAALAGAVVALLRDTESAARMGRAARATVEERYTRAPVLAAWRSVIAAVAGHGGLFDVVSGESGQGR